MNIIVKALINHTVGRTPRGMGNAWLNCTVMLSTSKPAILDRL